MVGGLLLRVHLVTTGAGVELEAGGGGCRDEAEGAGSTHKRLVVDCALVRHVQTQLQLAARDRDCPMGQRLSPTIAFVWASKQPELQHGHCYSWPWCGVPVDCRWLLVLTPAHRLVWGWRGRGTD